MCMYIYIHILYMYIYTYSHTYMYTVQFLHVILGKPRKTMVSCNMSLNSIDWFECLIGPDAEGLGKPVLVVAEEANPEIRLPGVDLVSLHPSLQSTNKVIEPAIRQKDKDQSGSLLHASQGFKTRPYWSFFHGSWNIFSINLMSKLSQGGSSFQPTSLASRKYPACKPNSKTQSG